MRKLWTVLCLAVCLTAAIFSAGCGGEDQGNKKVAINFENTSSTIWEKSGNALKDMLEKEGYTVDLQFAQAGDQQAQEIAEQLKEKPDCLVIGVIDSNTLVDVLAQAKEQGTAVIAYDRLIMGTDAVSYYATFDNEGVGEAMGEYIESKLDLKNGAGPFNIELFAGDPADNNAHLFFSGAMAVLQPYITSGQLVVPSGETTFDKVAIQGWKADLGQARMDKLLAGPDAGQQLAAVLAPNDSLAGGIRKALAAHGYVQMPLMTGQDAEDQAVEAIKNGQQSMTVYKPSEMLVAKSMRMIKAVVEGTRPDINNVDTYDNGVIKVPAYLCTPLVVDIENIGVVK